MINSEEPNRHIIKPIVDPPTYSIVIHNSCQLPTNYEAFVFSKWLRSLRFGNPLFGKIDSDDYYKNYHIYLSNLLKKPDSKIRLAVLSDDHDIVLGFAVSREDVLDYIYVHMDYGKIGIGSTLMPHGITTFTHITLAVLDIWQNNPKYKSLKFNPFA